MDIIADNNKIDLNNLYIGIKRTLKKYGPGDFDITDEYTILEVKPFSLNVVNSKNYRIFRDLTSNEQILMDDYANFFSTEKGTTIKIYGLVNYLAFVHSLFNEIRSNRRFKQFYNFLKNISFLEDINGNLEIILDDNVSKTLSISDELYFIKFGFPCDAISYFQNFSKELNIPPELICKSNNKKRAR